MIQLNDLTKEVMEVPNNESLSVVGGGDSTSLPRLSGSGYMNLDLQSPNYSPISHTPANTPYNSAWMAPIGSGSALTGIQGGDGNGNVYAVRQGGAVSWKNQSGTGAIVAPGLAGVSLGFSF